MIEISKPKKDTLKWIRRFFLIAIPPYFIYAISQSTSECFLMFARGEFAFACHDQRLYAVVIYAINLVMFLAAAAIEYDEFRKRKLDPSK